MTDPTPQPPTRDEAVRRAFRWFAKYPELKPNPEMAEIWLADIAAANKALSAAKPPASGVEEACEAAIRLSYFSKGRIMSYEGQPLGKGRLKADIQVVLEALPDTIRPPAEHGEAALDFYTADRLLTYVPETGDLLWRVHRGPKPKGSKAGCIRKDGYSYVVIGRKKFLAHRLCWLLHYGEWPSEHVDHINMNKVDNRLLNLRAATSAQNNLNRTKQSNNSSGFKGVRFHKKSGKYLANIVFEGVKRHLGQFPTPQEASEAYRKAAKELHGEFFNHS